MADQDAQDRNLPASAKKIKRSRAEGQVPRSRDLTHFVVLVSAGAMMAFAGGMIVDKLQHLLIAGLSFDARMMGNGTSMLDRLGAQTLESMSVFLPLCGGLALAAVAANLASGGWNWTFKPLMPNFGHLDPISGIGRLVSGAGLGQALKAVALALVLGVVGAVVLKDRIASYVGIMSVPLPAAIAYAGHQLIGGLALLGLALAVFAGIDVPLQRQIYMRRLRMTREEAKQEMKDNEGSPEIKQRIRAKMREMARKRMLAAVPSADLVVMNPTHYAVALRYDEAKMAAPRVVAKGADLMALKIRDLAKDSKVPVLQSPVLARALYAHAEIDREIPAALFAAVAQVLAYVYQLRAALSGRGRAPAEPTPYVPPELDPHNKPKDVVDADIYEEPEAI